MREKRRTELIKSNYKKPDVELIKFDYSDIIKTSRTCYGQDSTPHLTTFNK